MARFDNAHHKLTSRERSQLKRFYAELVEVITLYSEESTSSRSSDRRTSECNVKLALTLPSEEEEDDSQCTEDYEHFVRILQRQQHEQREQRPKSLLDYAESRWLKA